MRISADRNDPGFNEAYRYGLVRLDGREVKDAVSADEEQRAVVVFVYDEKYRSKRGEWPKRVLVGDVRISFVADAPDWVREAFPDRMEVASI